MRDDEDAGNDGCCETEQEGAMNTMRVVRLWHDLSDEELMQHLAAGEQEALAPLHSRYAPLIFNLAAQSLDRAAAEEIAQDVFLAIWRKAETYDPARGALRPWLLRIAHLRIINELRRRGRRPQLLPDPDGLHYTSAPDQRPQPEEEAWQEYRRVAVREAVEHLPPPQQQALRLAFFEDLTHEQVASFLNIPLGTAKTRIRTGMQKLRLFLLPLACIVLVLLAGALVALGVRQRGQQQTLATQLRALHLVTTSDLAPLRLNAAPGVPAETHGTYRGRAGNDIAVLTFEHFAPAPADQTYQIWARHGDHWLSLGSFQPEADGSALLIVTGDSVTTLPDALEVTIEPAHGSSAPTGPVIAAWP
jgi:RNA polymerase sigma-70 factor (ECF subfamily)